MSFFLPFCFQEPQYSDILIVGEILWDFTEPNSTNCSLGLKAASWTSAVLWWRVVELLGLFVRVSLTDRLVRNTEIWVNGQTPWSCSLSGSCKLTRPPLGRDGVKGRQPRHLLRFWKSPDAPSLLSPDNRRSNIAKKRRGSEEADTKRWSFCPFAFFWLCWLYRCVHSFDLNLCQTPSLPTRCNEKRMGVSSRSLWNGSLESELRAHKKSMHTNLSLWMSCLDMSQSNLLVVEGVNSKSQETKGFPPTLLLVAFFFF